MIQKSGMRPGPAAEETMLVITAQTAGEMLVGVDEEDRDLHSLKSRLAGLAITGEDGEYRPYAILKIVGVRAARLNDIAEAIRHYRPAFIHFAGHCLSDDFARKSAEAEIDDLQTKRASIKAGETVEGWTLASIERELSNKRRLLPHVVGGIRLKTSDGKGTTVPLSDLANLLRGRGIIGVFLNACWSILQALSLLKAVKFVVGTNSPINDAAAGQFAVGFWGSILQGDDLQQSFDIARSIVGGERRDQFQIPELRLSEGLDPTTWRLFDPNKQWEVPDELAKVGVTRNYEKKVVVAEGDALDRAWPPSSDGDPDDDTRAG